MLMVRYHWPTGLIIKLPLVYGRLKQYAYKTSDLAREQQ